ncbi:MAG TPA: EAL domain-containing protein [Lysobacter sp.]
MPPRGFAVLIFFAALAALLTASMLEIQAGATAYIVGESHWSRAQQETVSFLYRYTQYGDPADLQRTREALKVPMGDRAGRLALERRPRDEYTAQQGFLQGRNAPEDIGRLIWMYKYFAGAPYFRDSVGFWRQGDQEILKLAALADEIEAVVARAPLDAKQIAHYQQRLQAIDRTVRPIELAFSQSLLRGARLLRGILLTVSAVIFLVITWCAIVVLRWTVRSIGESEGKFRAAFHQAAVGMAKMDRDGCVIEVNEAFGSILGYAPPELVGTSFFELFHPNELGRIGCDGDGAVLWDDLGAPMDQQLLRSDGSTVWGRWTASVIRNTGAPDRVFVIIEDVSEAHQLSTEMAHQATHDSLTGLINRREIERRLEQAVDSARRTGVRHALCFIDLDQFKLVNDTCGHAVGDELLRRFASTIQLYLRQTDWLGRLGGDEFAVFLERTSLKGAERVAEKINEALSANTFAWGGRSFNVTCSIGVVEITSDSSDLSWLLRAADTACYLAKEGGRNRIRTYHETDEAVASRRGEMEWVGEIRRAIAEGRLVLYAQSIEPLRGPKGLQYEVLVRLVDADGKVYSPGAFLPAAERYGQSVAIDRKVVDLVFEQLTANPRHLKALELCHINVSGPSISDAGFRAHVVDLLESGVVPPRKLCFEITETAAIGNLAEARAFIDAVRSRGCLISLDDFGSGLSSFGYLKNLTIDILKIDGIFVRDMAHDEIDFALVRSICDIGRTLGKRTIAEWVETEAVRSRLEEVGVDFVQGYAIHKPCLLSELMRTAPGGKHGTGSPRPAVLAAGRGS